MLHSSPGPGPPVVVVEEVASVSAWVEADVDVDVEAVVLTGSLATVAEAVVVAESTAGSLAWHAQAAAAATARARRGSQEGGCEARGCAGGVVWVVMVRRRRLGSVRWRWLGQAAEADVLHSWDHDADIRERDTLGPLVRKGARVGRVDVAVRGAAESLTIGELSPLYT